MNETFQSSSRGYMMEIYSPPAYTNFFVENHRAILRRAGVRHPAQFRAISQCTYRDASRRSRSCVCHVLFASSETAEEAQFDKVRVK